MNYCIHLTDRCNLRCKYCYQTKQSNDISLENIKNLIDYEIGQKNKYSVITFFGGEPLLKKDLIVETINYIKFKKSKTKFYFGITTNGTLIDDEFMELVKNNKFVDFAYSFDGMKETQDLNRVTVDGRETFDIVYENAKKVLKCCDVAVAMMAVTKNNIGNLSKNVDFLIKMGFKYINIQFDYKQDWQDEDLLVIKKQYEEVAEIYAEKILQEEDITIPLIDEKINTYVNKKNCNEECEFGLKNINVGTDGNFYPCMQFVKNPDYIIGNCKDGIDIKKRADLIKMVGIESETCKKCKINTRCKHTCACKNYRITSDANEVSPIVCETEKIIIDVADKMAGELYSKNSGMFIQKYYNKNYGLIRQLINRREKDGDKRCRKSSK